MAERNGGTSNVAIIAIIVLVIIVGIFLWYFFGARDQTTINRGPNYNIETPNMPGTRPDAGTRGDSNR